MNVPLPERCRSLLNQMIGKRHRFAANHHHAVSRPEPQPHDQRTRTKWGRVIGIVSTSVNGLQDLLHNSPKPCGIFAPNVIQYVNNHISAAFVHFLKHPSEFPPRFVIV